MTMSLDFALITPAPCQWVDDVSAGTCGSNWVCTDMESLGRGADELIRRLKLGPQCRTLLTSDIVLKEGADVTSASGSKFLLHSQLPSFSPLDDWILGLRGPGEALAERLTGYLADSREFVERNYHLADVRSVTVVVEAPIIEELAAELGVKLAYWRHRGRLSPAEPHFFRLSVDERHIQYLG